MITIAAENLMLTRGGATLLHGLSFSIGPTGSVAVIGPNGAGKSLLIKTLTGIVAPTSGRVRIDGKELSRLPSMARVRTIGYLPQNFEPHWDYTVSELVWLGAQRGRSPSQDTVDKVAEEFKLGALRQRRWSTLSGGERGRVLLAMVLATDPPALLADEPGASLDIRHRIDLVQALVRRSADKLSVVVMHDLDLAFRFFDRVIVIDRGRIVADAAPRDLVEDRRLDATFGVTFERLSTPHGLLLRAT
jgi:iron complex transport system ATP-binding protein